MRCLSRSILAVVWSVGCSAAMPSKGAEEQRPLPPANTAPRPLPPPVPTTAPPGAAAIKSEPPPTSSTGWGTPHPSLFAAASPAGDWVAVCQARTDTNGDGAISVGVGQQGELGGDRLDGYLVTEPGPGEPIDSFAGNDPTGRFVAFVRDDRLSVLDLSSRTAVDLTALGADPRDDQSAFVHHRAVAFDPNGSRMLYFRRAGERTDIVVRDLATGSERTFQAGDGEVWRADFDRGGRHVIVKVAANDTNRNGRLDWFIPPRKRQVMRCPSPIPRYPVWEYPGDRPTTRVVSLEDGTVKDSPDLVFMVGDALLERRADKSLVLRGPGGAPVQVASAKCEGRVLHVDAATTTILHTCRNKTGRHSVHVFSRGTSQVLPLEMGSGGSDHTFDGAPRLVPIHAGPDAALYDLESRKLIRLRSLDHVVAVEADAALVLRENGLVLYDRIGGERALDGVVHDFTRFVRTGSFVHVSPLVVNLATRSLVGSVDADVVAMSHDGRALVAQSPADAYQTLTGPFGWLTPTVVPTQ